MNVAKTIQKVLNDEKFMNNILLESRSLDEVYTKLGYLLSYHISTRSKKVPDQKVTSPDYLTQEQEWQKLSPQKLKANIIDNGYVTHSFNGYNLKRVKKYGLGDPRIYDDKLGEELNFLCSVLGEGEYTANQGGGKSEVYYSAPGAKTFHYACGYSPERLWLGPLKQDRNNALPIKVGESKIEYALRVLEKKVSDLGDTINNETKEEVLEKGAKVIEKLCSQKPVVALIPITSKKHKLTAYHSSTRRQHETEPMLIDLLKKGTGQFSPEHLQTFFTENTNLIEFNNLGNLVHNGRIKPSELQLFEVEDSFSLMQQKAKLMGMKKGEEVDYFTGNVYIPKQDNVEQKSKKEKQKFVSPLKRRIQNKSVDEPIEQGLEL